MTPANSHRFTAGQNRLRTPILPLVRLVQLLYLACPFSSIESILNDLVEPIETNAVTYENPAELLRPYLDILKEFEALKAPPAPPDRLIVKSRREEVAFFEALELWVSHQVLTRELEEINSLLCGPCKCTLCCIGPSHALLQDFFEIPLSPSEMALFTVHRVDTAESRQSTANAEPALIRDGLPFYQTSSSLYHWRTGWSLILPRHSICPNLDKGQGICRIYSDRPEVCRRPQIFSYMLERRPDLDRQVDGRILPAFCRQRKLLAIWDCPYVRELKDAIAGYAEMCELEPVFKENKA